MIETLLQSLSKYVRDLKFKDLTEEVISKANDAIFDLLGCYYGSLNDKTNQIIIRNALKNSSNNDVTIWGVGRKGSLADSAMAMGFCGYSLEYDDGVSLAGHWGSASIPACIATAEKNNKSGEDLIVSIVSAYEVGTRISRIYSSTMLKNKIHFPCAMGFYAAASGVGKLMDLDSKALTLGFSNGALAPVGPYSTAVSGGQIKSMYSGWPNFLGIRLMEFAADGIGGDEDIFESKDGLGVIFLDEPLSEQKKEEVLSSLGKEYMLMQSYFKPYPCCRWLHSPLYLLEGILKDNPNKQISEIKVYGPNFLKLYDTRGCYEKKVKAQYSIPYTLAAMLINGSCGVEEFEEPFRTSNLIKEYTDKIVILADEDLESQFPKSFTVRLEVTFSTSEKVEKVGGLPWSPNCPATKIELINKFKTLTSSVLSTTTSEQLIKLYKEGFEKKNNFKTLLSILSTKIVDL